MNNVNFQRFLALNKILRNCNIFELYISGWGLLQLGPWDVSRGDLERMHWSRKQKYDFVSNFAAFWFVQLTLGKYFAFSSNIIVFWIFDIEDNWIIIYLTLCHGKSTFDAIGDIFDDWIPNHEMSSPCLTKIYRENNSGIDIG